MGKQLKQKEPLNAFAIVDVNRRQKFAASIQAKETAKVKAYKFRKDAILNTGNYYKSSNDEPMVEFLGRGIAELIRQNILCK